MSTSDETTPELSGDAAAAVGTEAPDAEAAVAEVDVHPDAHEDLSPAVRRLVRQYDLDVTAIQGTGPDGRIKVGDVIGMLGPRAEQAVRGIITPRSAPLEPAADVAETPADVEAAVSPTPTLGGGTLSVVTTVFECDLARVLAHRKRSRTDNIELLLTSYFLCAFVEALVTAPEIALGAPPRIAVELTSADGNALCLTLDAAATQGEPLTERVRSVDAQLRRNVGADFSGTNLLVNHYGASGSLLATPLPLRAGHAASAGIGRVRRDIALRNVDGDETPRVTARCHLSLSFVPDLVSLQRANQFMAHAVRLLEQWPE